MLSIPKQRSGTCARRSTFSLPSTFTGSFSKITTLRSLRDEVPEIAPPAQRAPVSAPGKQVSSRTQSPKALPPHGSKQLPLGASHALAGGQVQ
jgi:hypothetical protein